MDNAGPGGPGRSSYLAPPPPGVSLPDAGVRGAVGSQRVQATAA